MMQITTDSSQVDKMLDNFDDDEKRRKIMLDSILAGAKVLQESTMQQMRSSWAGSSHYSQFVGGPIYTGVRLKKDKAYSEVTVDILSNNTSGDWRIRFYESQIKQRKTKKGYNRGTVPAYHFFRTARQNSAEQVSQSICDKATQEFDKLANK